MSVSKKIKFYVFDPQPSMWNNGLNPKSTIDCLNMIIKEKESYIFKYDNEDYTIDIIQVGNDYVFGAISRENELQYTNFYQLRNKETGKAIPYTSHSAETQLEVYTFFYIDCNYNRMAVLQHKNINHIHNILSEWIWNLSENRLEFFCAPEKIKNVHDATRKLKYNKTLSIAFAPNESKFNIDNLMIALGDIQYDSYSIKVKLSPDNKDSTIDKLYTIIKDNGSIFKETKLSGKNEYGLEETIDFIETQFTQGVIFDITDDMIQNAEIIKDKLLTALKQNKCV